MKRKKSIWKTILITVGALLLALVVISGGILAFAYHDFSENVQKTYEPVKRQEDSKTKAANLSDKQPFSVLLLGIDTGAFNRYGQGRSDSIMVVTVNPTKKQTTVVSIARDTYVDIVGHGTQDKINHAYAFGGAAMSMDTVQKYLDIPIQHYVTMNMRAIKDLVDVIGGIEVENDLAFENSGFTFNQGKISLNGDQTLAFTRMRYDDPRGDYGRQERQRMVVKAVAEKFLSVYGVSKYREILQALSENMKTDLDQNAVQQIMMNYRDAFNNVKMDQLQGTGFMKDGISYQSVSPEELQRVQQELKDQLA
ncbi:MAG TPA: LCP family protein [Enterococcus columbae]|nr:LCP family protein [Enterococcus columbae]